MYRPIWGDNIFNWLILAETLNPKGGNMQNSTSKKIIAQSEKNNAWLIDGQVYVAPKTSIIDVYGNPAAARWECTFAHWERNRLAFPHFVDC